MNFLSYPAPSVSTLPIREPAFPERTLLLVEDDDTLADALGECLSGSGYAVTRAVDGRQGLAKMMALPPYDLVLLDLVLPDRSGYDLLREARQAGVHAPIIVLSGRADLQDRLQSFELGADDHLAKPFNTGELLARIQAVLRRSGHASRALVDVYHFGEAQFDFLNQYAQRKGERLALPPIEFKLLRYLVSHRGRTVTRPQILRDVWGLSGKIATRTIDRHIASLRRHLGEDGEDDSCIETVYGIGYKFIG